MTKGTIILLLCIGCVLSLLCPVIPAAILLGTAIYFYFHLPAKKSAKDDAIEMGPPKDDEDNEKYEDYTAKMYKEQVDESLKPGYKDDPVWQEKAKRVDEHLKEQQTKAEQSRKDEWKDDKDRRMDERIKAMGNKRNGAWWKYI